MFQPGFVESENSEIVLKDFDADTLASLLEFIYTAKITITEENAQVRITKRPLSQTCPQDILIGANLLLLYPVREAAGEVAGKAAGGAPLRDGRLPGQVQLVEVGPASEDVDEVSVLWQAVVQRIAPDGRDQPLLLQPLPQSGQ